MLMLEVEGPVLVLISPDRSINNDNVRTDGRAYLKRGRFEWMMK